MNHRVGVERTIEALAASQFGVFSRAQAVAAGVTRSMIGHRISVGAWLFVLPAVLRVAAVPRTKCQAAMAAALWCNGLVSHATAGELWAFEGITTTEVHVTVPATRRPRSELVVVHRVGDLLPADISRRGPIAVTSPLRTAIDLAGVVTADALEIAIESALRRRLFSVGQLRWRSDALIGTGRRGSASLRALVERRGVGRTESAWEVRTAQLLVAAGFPQPTRQHSICVDGKEIARVDLAYPESKLVLEYDSDQWHSGTRQRHRDAARRNQLRALGWTVVEVTPETLRHPAEFVAVVSALVAA